MQCTEFWKSDLSTRTASRPGEYSCGVLGILGTVPPVADAPCTLHAVNLCHDVHPACLPAIGSLS